MCEIMGLLEIFLVSLVVLCFLPCFNFHYSLTPYHRENFTQQQMDPVNNVLYHPEIYNKQTTQNYIKKKYIYIYIDEKNPRVRAKIKIFAKIINLV